MGQSESQSTNRESPATTVEEVATPQPEHFDELARQYEEVLERAKSLGLNVLAESIKETASSLNSLQISHEIISTKRRLLGSTCYCRRNYNLLDPHSEWTCNLRNDKCHCDKSSWENIIYVETDREQNRKSIFGGNEATKDQAIHKGKCLPSTLSDCCCQSFKVKGKASYETRMAGATSSEDDPTTRSQDEIVIVEASSSIQSKSTSERMPSEVSSSLKASHASSRIKHDIKKNQGIKSQLMCSCGCRYFLDGEFKMCHCGCEQLFEIVDEVDKKNSSSEGLFCECAGDGENNSKPISDLSLRFNGNADVMVEPLEMKCRLKDGMIIVLAEALRNSGDVDNITDHLAAPCLRHIDIDFNRSVLYEYLKRQSCSDISNHERLILDDSVPSPKNFRVAKPILNSLYLAWDLPDELCNIRGYEILVNGVVTSRVRSATRSQAILTSIDLSRPTDLTLYSVSTSGHISEPLSITFKA